MAALAAAFSPAASSAAGCSAGVSPGLASVALALAAGTLTGTRGFTWSGTGAWRISTVDFCTVGAAAILGEAGRDAEGAGSDCIVLVTIGGAGAAGSARWAGGAALWGAVVSRLALATPAAVTVIVATRMPRFICRPNPAPPATEERRQIRGVAR